MFTTAEIFFRPDGGARSAPELIVTSAWPHHLGAFALPERTAAGIEAHAEVNHGRWIVRCPFCPGAQLASETDHRFLCVDCLHIGTKAERSWIRVRWPEDRPTIEGVLELRPLTARNFDPRTETVRDLVRENLERRVIQTESRGT